jgi:argininosuccinate lyase
MKGLPFRDAHAVVGKSVAYGIEQGKDLADLSLQEIQNFSTLITDDVFDVLTLEGSVNARKHLGGTAPEQVLAAVASARAVLDKR